MSVFQCISRMTDLFCVSGFFLNLFFLSAVCLCHERQEPVTLPCAALFLISSVTSNKPKGFIVIIYSISDNRSKSDFFIDTLYASFQSCHEKRGSYVRAEKQSVHSGDTEMVTRKKKKKALAEHRKDRYAKSTTRFHGSTLGLVEGKGESEKT